MVNVIYLIRDIIVACTFVATLKMTPWRELRARKIPRRLFLNQESIVVAEGASEAYLSISVACIAPKQRTFWLIFQAKTGDFIIQVSTCKYERNCFMAYKVVYAKKVMQNIVTIYLEGLENWKHTSLILQNNNVPP